MTIFTLLLQGSFKAQAFPWTASQQTLKFSSLLQLATSSILRQAGGIRHADKKLRLHDL